ncbi:hypothetical protein [Hyphococcus aureus]|uniref:Uncharacterized protein n=2 Tax=Hyphococcus aureus TaxID=2666033 RepID=A0ABW1L204_9PROT
MDKQKSAELFVFEQTVQEIIQTENFLHTKLEEHPEKCVAGCIDAFMYLARKNPNWALEIRSVMVRLRNDLHNGTADRFRNDLKK